jgi:hypothetical protein
MTYVTFVVEMLGNVNEGVSFLAFRAMVYLRAIPINWVAQREDLGGGGISYGTSRDPGGDKESHDSACEE